MWEVFDVQKQHWRGRECRFFRVGWEVFGKYSALLPTYFCVEGFRPARVDAVHKLRRLFL